MSIYGQRRGAYDPVQKKKRAFEEQWGEVSSPKPSWVGNGRTNQQQDQTNTSGGMTLSERHKQELLDIIEGRDTYAYDAQSDPVYQQYRDAYARGARSAAEDVYANAVARSGGFGNSYAGVAAQQAYDTQMEGVADIIPELEELAYGRHKTAQQEKLSAYNQLLEMEDAEHETMLNNAYLYAFNGTKEGLWGDATTAEEAIRAKFPNMTDQDFETIKAEMYDGGLWSATTEETITTTEGKRVSQTDVDEAYNFLVGLMQGTEDSEGIDVMARQSYVAQLAEHYGISEDALQGAYDKLDAIEQANVEDTQRNAQTLIEEAMAGVSDKYYDPTVLGIDAEEWAGLSDDEREGEVMMIAEGMAARGELSSKDYQGVVWTYVKNELESEDIEAISLAIKFVDDIEEEAMSTFQKQSLKIKMAEILEANGIFEKARKMKAKMNGKKTATAAKLVNILKLEELYGVG